MIHLSLRLAWHDSGWNGSLCRDPKANTYDQITFGHIDYGLFPSPDLGAESALEPDDWPRLRALCVEQLQRAGQHTFLAADQVLHGLNYKLSFLPTWLASRPAAPQRNPCRAGSCPGTPGSQPPDGRSLHAACNRAVQWNVLSANLRDVPGRPCRRQGSYRPAPLQVRDNATHRYSPARGEEGGP